MEYFVLEHAEVVRKDGDGNEMTDGNEEHEYGDEWDACIHCDTNADRAALIEFDTATGQVTGIGVPWAASCLVKFIECNAETWRAFRQRQKTHGRLHEAILVASESVVIPELRKMVADYALVEPPDDYEIYTVQRHKAYL